jgi:aminopeptidase N
MATYLAEVSIGEYELVDDTSPGGVRLRHAFPPALAAAATRDFASTGEMVDFFGTQFGPYPFTEYGALVVDATFGFALETQTRSMFDRAAVDGRGTRAVVFAHELAHQWFGDSVTLSSWPDIWLNEGFATYAEWLWQEHTGVSTAARRSSETHDLLTQNPALAQPPAGEPGAANLFGPTVYLRGGLTLQALRLTIGDAAFFDTLQTWAAERKGANGSTADFVATAEAASGMQLDALFDAWLYQEPLPPLP